MRGQWMDLQHASSSPFFHKSKQVAAVFILEVSSELPPPHSPQRARVSCFLLLLDTQTKQSRDSATYTHTHSITIINCHSFIYYK